MLCSIRQRSISDIAPHNGILLHTTPRKPIRTIINNSYHISSMLLVASREIRTNISPGIYEARYDRKIARMVAQSILVGFLGGGWGGSGARWAGARGRRGNFERLLVQASVVERGRDETARVQANKSNCSVGARV